MRNPYEVLEVSQNASMDEIKEQYKKLIKKYHPDKYQNNPLADLADEKLKEINEAYDYLCKNHKGGGSYGGSYGRTGGNGGYSPSTDFAAVRNYIDMGNIEAADAILRNSQVKNAEWYFLSGMVAYRKGWFDQAVGMVQQAVNMDPNNFEYRRNLDAMRGNGGAFRNTAYGRGYTSNDDLFCRACQTYLCLDCLCDCF